MDVSLFEILNRSAYFFGMFENHARFMLSNELYP
jgi:hypothetical protein